ncbi:MAG: Maf family nucleotide pyrophosphatase [Gammaproteobacteria bacterium]|jgi:septum formation protein
MNLILASTSAYRKELLSRLGLPFRTAAPDVDESPRGDETPEQLVLRLAEAKARAVAAQHPDALIIGSDQVAAVEGQVLGKPGDHERALAQLRLASGKCLQFLTGVCLLNALTGRAQVEIVPFSVVFRKLSDRKIENYLRRERPYHCAGAFKSEALGITLCERLEGEDPTALIGLPLIRLTYMLEQEGVNVI